MQPLLELLRRCAESHSFDSGDPDCKTVLDQLYRAYAESHENDPPGIREGFKELENFLEVLALDDNNAVFNLCCRILRVLRRILCKRISTKSRIW